MRASVLHFWLAYKHPFVDGNGRTAPRANWTTARSAMRSRTTTTSRTSSPSKHGWSYARSTRYGHDSIPFNAGSDDCSRSRGPRLP
ncbi:MAG: Fic family protein [Planctomycetes bacterium]|nr:Fic family protein [Planctomycetota bacterium]